MYSAFRDVFSVAYVCQEAGESPSQYGSLRQREKFVPPGIESLLSNHFVLWAMTLGSLVDGSEHCLRSYPAVRCHHIEDRQNNFNSI